MSKQMFSVFKALPQNVILQNDLGLPVQGSLMVFFYVRECEKEWESRRRETFGRISWEKYMWTCFPRSWPHWDLAVGVSFNLTLFSWFFLHSSVGCTACWRSVLQEMERHLWLPWEGGDSYHRTVGCEQECRNTTLLWIVGNQKAFLLILFRLQI